MNDEYSDFIAAWYVAFMFSSEDAALVCSAFPCISLDLSEQCVSKHALWACILVIRCTAMPRTHKAYRRLHTNSCGSTTNVVIYIHIFIYCIFKFSSFVVVLLMKLPSVSAH